MDNKLATITNLFEGKEIRSIWDAEKEDYYFSVIDVIQVLTDSNIPKRYWTDLKRKLINEGSELYEKIVRLKVKAQDGKMRETDTLDTKGIFRLIESIPSPKAEPFKMWLAKLGSDKIDEAFDPSKGIDQMIDFYLKSIPSPKAEPFKMWLAKLSSDKIDEAFDPSKGIDQMIDFYLKKGYALEWIESRIKTIIDRKKLTNTWKENGVTEGVEYAILTNDIYKEWSGMTAGEYKSYKGIRKEI